MLLSIKPIGANKKLNFSKMKFISVLKSRNGKPIDFNAISDKIEEICRTNNLLLLYIYGSYANDRASHLSDLDLAYLSEEEISWEKESKIINEFIELFEEEAIDLVNLEKVPVTLIHRILKEGKCLYAKDISTKIEFEMTKESMYYDTYPLRKEYFEKMMEKLLNGTFWD